MTVRYVQTNDNNYVQFRYMGTSTAVADFTNITNWQGMDIVPVPNSQNLVSSGTVYASIDGLKKSVFAEKYIEADIYQTISNKYIKSNGDTESNNSYSIKLIEVNYGDILRIVGNSQLSSGTAPAYALYSSSDLSSSTLIQLGQYTVSNNFDTKVYVPQGAKYLALVQHSQYLTVNAYTIEDITSLDVFNISEYNKSGNPEVFASYVDISSALGTDGENIPVERRKGGMIGVFINSQTQHYEIYRLKTKEWSADINNWINMDTSQISNDINTRILGSSKKELINLNSITSQNLVLNSSGIWTAVNGKHIVIPCVTGDRYYIKANDNKYTHYAFLTSESAIVNTAAHLVSGTSRYVLPIGESVILTIPDTCNFLYILKSNMVQGVEEPGYLPSECYKVYDCSNLLKYIDELESEIYNNDYNELTPSSTISGKYINSDGSLGSLGVYSIKLVNVQDVEKVKISGVSVNLSNGILAFAFYNSSELSSSTFIGGDKKYTNESFNVEVNVPQGATILALVQEYSTSSRYFTSTSYSVTKKSKFDDIDNIENNFIEFSKQGNTIVIGTHYKDKKMGITIGAATGANGLVDFRNVFTYDADSSIAAPSNINYIIPAVGDMHAPFLFRSDGLTDTTSFTGGGHTYSDGAIKTAKLDFVEFYADGALIETNGIGICRNIKVKWANSVKAGNAMSTETYALKEIHTLIYDGIKFEEWIDLVPLTDILMGLWYAFEFEPIKHQSGVMFANAAHRQEYGVSENAVSGGKSCDKEIIVSETDGICVSMSIDNSFDLGKGNYLIDNALYSTDRCRFIASTKKSYFTIISSGYSVEMQEGLHYRLHGYYNFDE